jgi:hypothetical protein
MDTFTSLAGLALAIFPSLGIAAAIRALADNDDPASTLPGFLAPLVAPATGDGLRSRPLVREEEPVRWRVDLLRPATPASA